MRPFIMLFIVLLFVYLFIHYYVIYLFAHLFIVIYCYLFTYLCICSTFYNVVNFGSQYIALVTGWTVTKSGSIPDKLHTFPSSPKLLNQLQFTRPPCTISHNCHLLWGPKANGTQSWSLISIHFRRWKLEELYVHPSICLNDVTRGANYLALTVDRTWR